MDYTQEQADELEALEAIFMDDLQEVEDSVPSGWKPTGKVYRVVVSPQQEDGQELEYPLRVEVVFAHTPSYPDEPPLLKARGLQGLSDAVVGQLQSQLESAVQDNLGMAMVYTLVTLAQEWVQERASEAAGPTIDPEADKRRRLAEEEARLAALRAHGTMVTPENFAEWRARFDAEQALARSKLAAAEGSGAVAERPQRLTGKQWFLQQDAEHREVEEPELEADEEDGEGDRASWGSSAESEEEDDFDDEGSSVDEDELLEAMLAGKGGA